MEGVGELLKELDIILEQAQVCVIDAASPEAGEQITAQLCDTGVALVLVPDGVAAAALRQTGTHAAETFTRLSEGTKNSLRQGRFTDFSKEWQTQSYDNTRIAGKSNGMANLPPLDPELRDSFRWLNTVHVNNTVNASANLCLWQTLAERNPSLHPSQWYTSPLKRAGDRVQVSEDGIKVMQRCTYEPTALHYNGQRDGDNTDAGGEAESRRIQVVFSADSGPVRLFAVPGSHLPRVQRIIELITGEASRPGFVALRNKHLDGRMGEGPNGRKTGAADGLQCVLCKYGVALPSTGLLMFRANVWHFEAASEVVAEAAPVSGGQLPLGPARPDLTIKARSKISASSVFRIYCGVVSVAPRDVERKLIPLAWMREHGWCMDPYTRSNQAEELFVNQKTTQYLKVTHRQTEQETADFAVLRGASLSDMKAELQLLPQTKLALYGLTPEDVEVASASATEAEAPSKKQKNIVC